MHHDYSNPSGEFLEVYGKNHPTFGGEPRIATAGVYPVYDAPLGSANTLYSKVGNVLGWLSLAGLIFMVLQEVAQRRQPAKEAAHVAG